jgi:hypothetical protein
MIPVLLALFLLALLPRVQRLRTRLGLVTGIILFVALAGCSGPKGPGTPKGQSTLTITCASTGSAGAVTHTATTTLTVN